MAEQVAFARHVEAAAAEAAVVEGMPVGAAIFDGGAIEAVVIAEGAIQADGAGMAAVGFDDRVSQVRAQRLQLQVDRRRVQVDRTPGPHLRLRKCCNAFVADATECDQKR